MENVQELVRDLAKIEHRVQVGQELIEGMPKELPGVAKILYTGAMLFDVQGWNDFWVWRRLMGNRLLPGNVGHDVSFETGVITRKPAHNYFGELTMSFFYSDQEWPEEVWKKRYLSYSGEDSWEEEHGVKWIKVAVCVCGTNCTKVQVGTEPKYEWRCEGA